MQQHYPQDPSRPPEGEASFDRHLVVLFPVGTHQLAVVAEQVREVVTVGKVTALPPATDSLLGAISVRGLLLPLYSLHDWCGDIAPEYSDRDVRFAAICEVEHSSFAIQATDNPTIVMTTTEISHATPVVIDGEVCLGVVPQQLLNDLTRRTLDPQGTFGVSGIGVPSGFPPLLKPEGLLQ